MSGILGGDEYLLENSRAIEDSLGQYYIEFFGEPSDSSVWEVQFGGHRLGINATLDGSANAITFALTHLVRATGDTRDCAEGTALTGAELTDEQNALLLDLIANWAETADDDTSATARSRSPRRSAKP